VTDRALQELPQRRLAVSGQRVAVGKQEVGEVALQQARERVPEPRLDAVRVDAEQVVREETKRAAVAVERVGEGDRAAVDGDVEGALVRRQLADMDVGDPGAGSSWSAKGSIGSSPSRWSTASREARMGMPNVPAQSAASRAWWPLVSSTCSGLPGSASQPPSGGIGSTTTPAGAM